VGKRHGLYLRRAGSRTKPFGKASGETHLYSLVKIERGLGGFAESTRIFIQIDQWESAQAAFYLTDG
jgi:hypothetical protein